MRNVGLLAILSLVLPIGSAHAAEPLVPAGSPSPPAAAASPAQPAAASQAPLPGLGAPLEIAPAPRLPPAEAAMPRPAAAPARPASAAVPKPAAPKPRTVLAAPKPDTKGIAKASSKAPTPPPEPIRLSDDPRPAFGPDTLAATLKAGERYQAIADAGGWPSVPSSVTRLKSGDEAPAVAVLRKRLAVTGDLADHDAAGPHFDETLTAGIRRFQARHGLEETGLVGPRTLVHLNIGAAQRVRQIQASAGRLAGSKFAFGDRYIAVNIPSAAVEAVERGVVARRYVAIVGRPERPSPQVETRVTSVNFNPTWTVPVSIIKKDIIPHVRKDPAYLAKMRIRLFDAQGQEIDPNTIDWSTNQAAGYTVRQDSGSDNSLGEIRIDMPNRHSVYMHDTPSKRLFARAMRAQSSGCVRVSGVKGLAAWLLEATPGPAGQGWSALDIETAIAAGRRVDARLSKPVPVAWIYMTGYGTPDGGVHFRDDVYALDEPRPETKPEPAIAAKPAEPLVTSSIAPVRR